MKKQKVLKVLGAAALVGLTTLTMTSCSLTDWIGGIIHPTEKPETPTPDEDNKQDSGNVIVDGKELGKDETVDHMPQAIAFRRASNDVSAQSAQGATVTFNATVTPDNATDKSITWSLAWNGSDSGNVNDYVSLNITNETHTVTVTCNKVFNTQIRLTGKTSGGQTATATIDILKRDVSGGMNVDGYLGEEQVSNSFAFDFSDNFKVYDTNNVIGSNLTFGQGSTVRSNMESGGEYYIGFYGGTKGQKSGTIGTPTMSYYYNWTSEFEAYLKQQNATDIIDKKQQYYTEENYDESYDWASVVLGCNISAGEYSLMKKYSDLIDNYRKLSSNNYIMKVDLKIQSVYNGNVYDLNSGTVYFNYSIDPYIQTTGVSIGNSSSIITK